MEYLQPLFKAMGKLVIHIGETGKGQSAKLCMNLMIALIYEGFAEAYTLGQKLGVDPHKLIELIQASMVRSGVVDYKAPFVLRHDYSPNFPLRLMHKDIHLMLDAAKENRVKLPALETVDEIYELSSEEGWDDLDFAATLKLLEKWAGLAPAEVGLPARTCWPAIRGVLSLARRRPIHHINPIRVSRLDLVLLEAGLDAPPQLAADGKLRSWLGLYQQQIIHFAAAHLIDPGNLGLGDDFVRIFGIVRHFLGDFVQQLITRSLSAP